MTSQPTGRGQQRPHLQAGAAVEEAGEPAAHRPLRAATASVAIDHATGAV